MRWWRRWERYVTAVTIDQRTDAEKKAAYQYPHCESPGSFGMPDIHTYEGIRIYKTEVAPGSWMWMKDSDREAREDAELREEFIRKEIENKHIAELWFALQTRLLSEEEMGEVVQLGCRINEPSYGYYGTRAEIQCYQAAMARMTAYYNQARLQLLAKGAKWPRHENDTKRKD